MMPLSSELSKVCYTIKFLHDILIPLAIPIICFAICHVQLKYGLMLWCRDTESAGIFKLQKRFMKVISDIGEQTSFRQILRYLFILPVACVYTIEVMCYIQRNKENLEQNRISQPSQVPGILACDKKIKIEIKIVL